MLKQILPENVANMELCDWCVSMCVWCLSVCADLCEQWPWVCVCVSSLLFRLLHAALQRLSRPEVVRTHSWKNWKWNNLSVSIVHSTVTAVWAIASAAHSPVMLEDMYSATSPLAYLLVCFSTGYFIHDAADIVFSGNSRTSWEFLLHHVLVLFFFLRSIVTRLYVAGVVVALFVEVNSIFLHARRMLLLARIDTCSYHYSLARHINLFTFIFFRLGAQYLITRFIILNYTWLDHAPYLLAAIGAMNIMMLVYLCRLVRADFMTRRDNGRSRTHDKGNSLLKED